MHTEGMMPLAAMHGPGPESPRAGPLKEWLRLPLDEEARLSPNMWRGFKVTEQLAARVERAAVRSPIARIAQSTIVVAIQHGLIQTPDLFRHLINCGVPPDQIFWSDKFYSSAADPHRPAGTTTSWLMEQTEAKLGIHCCPFQCAPPGWFADVFPMHVEQNVWQPVRKFLDTSGRRIEQILILDDGGDALTTVPGDLLRRPIRIAGVEQTQHGLNKLLGHNLKFPIVEVASCALKKQIENRVVIESVISNLLRFPVVTDLLKNPDTVVGLLGYGALGAALLPRIAQSGVKCILVYDPAWQNKPTPKDLGTRVMFMGDIKGLAQASLFIGTTGSDVFKSHPRFLFRSRHQLRDFVSCSSGDIEFASLLRELTQPSGHCTLKFRPCQLAADGTFGSARFVYRGFPVNFAQRRCESANNEEIIMTEAALLMGCLQALEMTTGRRREGRFALLPSLQRLVYDTWISTVPGISERLMSLGVSSHLLEQCHREEYLAANSGGSQPGRREFPFCQLVTGR